jgi:hypothetical protein
MAWATQKSGFETGQGQNLSASKHRIGAMVHKVLDPKTLNLSERESDYLLPNLV